MPPPTKLWREFLMADISVVIPTYNGAAKIEATLRAVLAENPTEVIVVDDGSTDATAEVVAAATRRDARIRHLRVENGGPARARNLGAAQANTPLVVFIDDDIVVQRGFITRHLADHQAGGARFVVGRIRQSRRLLETRFGRYRTRLWEEFHDDHAPGVVATTGMTAANLSVPRDLFQSLGGFDEDFTIASSEDWELGQRAREAGVDVVYDPEAVGIHNDWADTLERFAERQRLYSVSDVLLVRKYGAASPRSGLVERGGPVDWRRDGLRLIVTKLTKSLLWRQPFRSGAMAVVRLGERVLPEQGTARLYDAMVGAAIQAGVRAGLERYGVAQVLHLIDANVDTAYFREIADNASKRFPVTIGSIAPEGHLQSTMRERGTPTFTLRASSRLAYPTATVRLALTVVRARARLIHAHCFDPALLGLIAARLVRRPFVFTRHHSDHNLRLGKRWHVAIDSFVARHADHVIAVSEATRSVLVESEGVRASSVTVVHNGATAVPAVTRDKLGQLSRELDLDGSRQVALTTARLHAEKGIDYLLEAAALLRDSGRDVCFLIAGDGPARVSLERRSGALGLSNRVRFLGFRDDVPALLSLATMLVHPALAESFGFSVLEALSAGVPVVCTNVGGLIEVVGDAALIVEPADAEGLATSIAALADDHALRDRLSAAARLRAAKFDPASMVRGYEAVYTRVLGR